MSNPGPESSGLPGPSDTDSGRGRPTERTTCSRTRRSSTSRPTNLRIVICDGPEKKRLNKNKAMRDLRSNWTEEQREKNRESSKQRMRKYRQNKKENKENNNQAVNKTKTRKQIKAEEERLMKQRQDKAIYRAGLSSQKKRRIREKDRNRKALKKQRNKEQEKDVNNSAAMDYDSEHQPESRPDLDTIIQGAFKTLSGRKKNQCHNRRVFINSIASQLKNKYGFNKSKLSKQTGIPRKHLVKPLKPKLRKKRKDAASTYVTSTIIQFYLKEENSINVPNRKIIEDGSCLQEKFILQKSLKKLHQDFEHEHKNITISFSAFCKLRPKNVKTQDSRKLLQCLCEKCENVELKLKSLNSLLKKNNEIQILDKYDAVSLTMCKKSSKFHEFDCIIRECDNCGINLLRKRLEPLFNSAANDNVTWNRWELVKVPNPKNDKPLQKRQQVRREGTLLSLVQELLDEVKLLAKHLFVASWQQDQFSKLNTLVPEGSIILTADFAENFVCFSQCEVQGAHWSKDSVTIHPTMALYRCMKCPSHHIIEEMVDVVSDDLVHDSHAVQVFFNKIFLHLYTRTDNITKAFILTDGCASQYKCKTVFMDATLSKKDYGLIIERGYYGSGHGKNRCDGEGGILKTRVSRAIRNDNAVVNNAMDFYQICKDALEMPETCLNGDCAEKRRTILWIPKGEISHIRPNREVKTVKGTREIHSLRGEEVCIIHTRDLSCFCEQCLNGTEECENSCYVKKWKKVELKPVNPIDTIEDTGVDLLDRSNLDVSFDPDQPAEFNASFGERLMGALDEVIDPTNSDGKQDEDLSLRSSRSVFLTSKSSIETVISTMMLTTTSMPATFCPLSKVQNSNCVDPDYFTSLQVNSLYIMLMLRVYPIQIAN